MNDRDWHEHVEAASLRALRQVREDLSAVPPYDNDVPYWPDTIIVHEGMGCWGASQTELFAALRRLGWRTDGRRAEPPADLSFEATYAPLCEAVPPRRTMTREAMQPLKEGHYPDADTWFEMFGSYPELHVEEDALVYEPARLALWEHAQLLDKATARCHSLFTVLAKTDGACRGARRSRPEISRFPSSVSCRLRSLRSAIRSKRVRCR